MPPENIHIHQLKAQLSELNPYLVLLFGSYAYGSPHEDSDIDLLVVTNDNFMPQTFKEKHEVYKRVSEKIRPIKAQVAIDLIVHTLPMYQKFIELNSSFAREITTQGIILYESGSTRVA
jgi:predicted nucleotidyltransferase